MSKRPQSTLELEAELLRLTTLVRARRKELDRLQKCPNKTCQCRLVWKEQVDKTLASQVRKIRKQLDNRPAMASRAKASS